jgi:hypothetical protein
LKIVSLKKNWETGIMFWTLADFYYFFVWFLNIRG